MHNSEKGFSSSKSTANPISSCVGENNENDSCQDNVIPKSQNHKKVVVKHFMSPTISAASKARKKILVERNENLITTSDNQSHGHMGNGDLGFNPSDGRYNESNRDGESNNVVSGSSLNAYDPWNNYFSPRPRFLRFDPNKRREIFSRFDREGCEVLKLSSLVLPKGNDQEDPSEEDGEISKVSPFDESNAEINETKIPKIDHDDDDDDDEEEGFEEDIEMERGGWCFRGVIKILFTAVSCLLFVSYICSGNSPSSSLSQNVMTNLSNGYATMINQQSFEPINSNVCGNDFLANQPEYDFDEAEYAADFEEHDDGLIEESFDLELAEDVYGNYEEIASEESDCAVDKVEEDVAMEDARSGGNDEKPYESIVLLEDALYETEREDSKVMDHHETYEELNVGSKEDLPESGYETDRGNEGLAQKTKSNNTLTIIGVSIISSIILAPLALLHYSRTKKIARAKESRSHTVKQQQHGFVSEDKATNLVEKKVEFLARSVQCNNTLMKESYETINDNIHAPCVELLGEIVIGQVSNLRICSETYNIKELKEVSTDTSLIRQLSLAQSGSTPTRPSSHVHSTSTESKSLRTMGHDIEEAVTEVTPLRRSARLRNRTTITSP